MLPNFGIQVDSWRNGEADMTGLQLQRAPDTTIHHSRARGRRGESLVAHERSDLSAETPESAGRRSSSEADNTMMS